jgi:serine/threonine protein phosphatase 1
MYIIGDIHSNADALESLVEQLKPQRGDGFIFLGDYIDKGPATRATLALLERLTHNYQCVFIKGNHEFVWDRYINHGEKYRREFLLKHGLASLEETRDDARELLNNDDTKTIKKILAPYFALVEKTIDYYLIDEYLALHAGLLETQFDQAPLVFTERNYFLRPEEINTKKKYLGKYTVVAGHNDLGTEPIVDEGLINLDLRAGYPGGFLGALNTRTKIITRSDGMQFSATSKA